GEPRIGMPCAGCTNLIWNEYTQYTIKGIRIIFCPVCAMQVTIENNRKKERLCSVIESVGKDLLRAQELDPDNQLIADNIQKVKKLADDVGATMPSVPAMERCGNCKRMKPSDRMTCPHCGKTDWGPLIVILVLGVICL